MQTHHEWHFEIDCSGQRHWLVGDGHDLRPVAHDGEAESAFAELGGRLPTCLAIVEAWTPDVVELWDDGIAAMFAGDDRAETERLRRMLFGVTQARQMLAAQAAVQPFPEELEADLVRSAVEAERLLVLLDAPGPLREAYVKLMRRGPDTGPDAA